MEKIVGAAICAGALLLATACSADANDSVDASNNPVVADAQQNGAPDAPPLIKPDAQIDPDAAPICPDDAEPNDTQGAATVLDNINDNDSNGSSVTGMVQDGDEDWFTYIGSDGAFVVDPTVTITGAVQVCLFLSCTSGDTSFTCPPPTTEPGGGPAGCCGSASFEIDDLNCSGTINESATVHMQISATTAGVCEAYTVGYHY